MSQIITLDVETIASPDLEVLGSIRRAAIEEKPSRNTLKALKDTWDSPESQNARVNAAMKKLACDPLVAYPIAFGIRTDFFDDTGPVLVFQGILALMEQLEQLGNPEIVWVGFNSEHFDLPVILNACRRAGIVPPADFPRMKGKYWTGRSFDCMLNSGTDTYGKMVSLKAVCNAFGVETDCSLYKGERMDGSRVLEAHMAGDTAAIDQHCVDDVNATAALFNKQTFGGTVLPF